MEIKPYDCGKCRGVCCKTMKFREIYIWPEKPDVGRLKLLEEQGKKVVLKKKFGGLAEVAWIIVYSPCKFLNISDGMCKIYRQREKLAPHCRKEEPCPLEFGDEFWEERIEIISEAEGKK